MASLPWTGQKAIIRAMIPQQLTSQRSAPQATGEQNDTIVHMLRIRVRYSETDQMGTVYNSRPLEWFECGRTELLRSLGFPYAELESRELFLPLIESHVEYLGRARYDDLLEMTTTLRFEGRARLRCAVQVVQADTRRPVVRGYTVHAFTDGKGKPIRPPGWLLTGIEQARKLGQPEMNS